MFVYGVCVCLCAHVRARHDTCVEDRVQLWVLVLAFYLV